MGPQREERANASDEREDINPGGSGGALPPREGSDHTIGGGPLTTNNGGSYIKWARVGHCCAPCPGVRVMFRGGDLEGGWADQVAHVWAGRASGRAAAALAGDASRLCLYIMR